MRLLDLEDDCLRNVVVHLRHDRLCNETVPGVIFEARVWRRLGRRFLALSRDTPSQFDSRISYVDSGGTHGMLPRAFSGGLLCSRAANGAAAAARASALQQEPQLFLLRDARTGRVWVVCTDWRSSSSTPLACSELRVHVVLTLQHLVQLLSGQNADFDSRLDHFDKLIAGHDVKTSLKKYANLQRNQSATGHIIAESIKEIDCAVSWGRSAAGCRLTNNPCVVINEHNNAYAIHFDDRQLLNNKHNHPGLPPISILLGFYDLPTVAECGGMQVGIHTHRLPAALLPKQKRNDPELHMRILGRAALDRAERIAAERCAIVVRDTTTTTAGASRRQRSAAVNARDGIRAGVQADSDVLSSGRIRFLLQRNDVESREDEAKGMVDDQYADLGEEDDEPVLYDSDGEYKDGNERTKREMRQERRAEAIAAQQSRDWMFPSDDDEDDI